MKQFYVDTIQKRYVKHNRFISNSKRTYDVNFINWSYKNAVETKILGFMFDEKFSYKTWALLSCNQRRVRWCNSMIQSVEQQTVATTYYQKFSQVYYSPKTSAMFYQSNLDFITKIPN